MDQFGVLVESIGFKSQSKSAPMADLKGKSTLSLGVNSGFNIQSQSQYNSNSANGSFVDDLDGIFQPTNNKKTQNYGGSDDIFGGPNLNMKPSDGGLMFDLDSAFSGSNNSGPKYHDDDDIFGGFSGLKSSESVNYDDVFGRMASPRKQNDSIDDLLGNFGGMGSKSTGLKNNSRKKKENASEFDGLIPGFGGSSPSSNGGKSETSRSMQSSDYSAKTVSTLAEDPFVILESSSSQSAMFSDPSDQSAGKNSVLSSIDELENFAMGRVHNDTNERSDDLFGNQDAGISIAAVKNTADGAAAKFRQVKVVIEKQNMEAARSVKATRKEKGKTAMHDTHEREVKAKQERVYGEQRTKEKERAQRRIGEERGASEIENHLDSFFSAQPSTETSLRSTSEDYVFDTLFQNGEGSKVGQTSSGTSSSAKKASAVTNIVDDFSFLFGVEAAPSSGEFQEIEGESEERRGARLNHYLRTQERMAKALDEKNQRDLQMQWEQEERHRLADTLDGDIKRWAAGKEGNLRALLSSLQLVLWSECGWQPVSLTDLITSISVKKVYYKATLCVHPDKVQQKGSNLQQKYIAEKVFDLLKVIRTFEEQFLQLL